MIFARHPGVSRDPATPALPVEDHRHWIPAFAGMTKLLCFAATSPISEAMPSQPISTSSAPKAIGPYSQAVRYGNTVYFSGQIPLDPASGELVGGDISAQT